MTANNEEYSNISTMKKLLPDLPAQGRNARGNRLQFTLEIDTKIGGNDSETQTFPIDHSDYTPTLFGQAVVSEDTIGFRVFLKGFLKSTALSLPPIKVKWSVKAKNQGKKFNIIAPTSSFLPVGVSGSSSVSEDIEVLLSDLTRYIKEDGKLTTEWTVILEWFCAEELRSFEEKSSLALNHMAYVIGNIQPNKPTISTQAASMAPTESSV